MAVMPAVRRKDSDLSGLNKIIIKKLNIPVLILLVINRWYILLTDNKWDVIKYIINIKMQWFMTVVMRKNIFSL